MGASGSKETVPADTVLLHSGFGRGPRSPTLSPFVFKVEFYLRIAKIPYKFTDKGGFGQKGKVPWIEYNGETVCDSHFIIQYLNKKFNVDLNKNLSEMEKATATAFRIMVEEYLNFSNGLEMIAWNKTVNIKNRVVNVPTPGIWIFKSKWSSRAKAQGIGSHNQEEIREITELQLNAISTLLGDKPYLMGDEPTELDCSVVGVLQTMKWSMDEDMHPRKLIEEKFRNINDYLERIKMKYYPDWEELLAPIGADKNKNMKDAKATENGDTTATTTKEDVKVEV